MNELYQGREPIRTSQQKDWFYRFALAAAIVFLFFGLVSECFSEELPPYAHCVSWKMTKDGKFGECISYFVDPAEERDAKIKSLEQRVRALEKQAKTDIELERAKHCVLPGYEPQYMKFCLDTAPK